MAKPLLIISFFLIWVSSLAFALGNISFSPNLSSVTEFYGPFNWQAESRSIGFKNNIPEFIIYGAADTGASIEPIVIRADFLEWARALSNKGRAEMGNLFATGLPSRPFVTNWDIKKDAGFWINIFSTRSNLSFFFWIFLSLIFPVIFYFWINTDINYVIAPKERWLKDEEFKEKVRELEIDYKDNSSGLRRKTVLIALLGYSVIWGVIGIIVSIAVGLIITLEAFTQWGYISVLAGLPALWLVLRLVKSFLMQSGGDSGVRLQRKDTPQLFNLLEKIQRKVKGPVFARIFIDMEMNASVSRHTGILGSFGFGPVTLTLGLPLMQALTVKELAGVIGHEYGHIAAKDNALSHWIYRIRNGWLDMGERLKLEPIWYILQLNRFYQWFIAIFNAYSFTLSRQCEYEADAFSAKIVEPHNIARALVAIEVRSNYIGNEFWDRIWKKAKTSPRPRGNPYQKIAIFFKTLNPENLDLEEIKRKKTDYNSTHPALSDRIKALGNEIKAPNPLRETAASKLLGADFEKQLALVFDRAWERHNRKKWRKQYNEHQGALGVLAKFKDSNLADLKRDDLMEMISAAYTIDDNSKVMDICGELLKRDPNNAAAEVNLLGYRLVRNNDESALLKIDDLVNVYPEHLATACRFAIKYLEKKQRYKEAEVYKFRLKDWGYKNEAAEEERKHIYSNDVFSYHSISTGYVQDIKKILKKNKNIKKAWLVRKEIDYSKENPLFVLAFKQSLFGFIKREKLTQEIKSSMSKAGFPPFFGYFWVEDVKGFEAKLKKQESSLIYKK